MTLPNLVLDTSAVINLLATDDPNFLVDALDVRLVVPRRVRGEVLKNPRTKKREENLVAPLLKAADVTTAEVESKDSTVREFLKLVSAPNGDDLGDGESATIAIANRLAYGVVLDDGKARRICRSHRPEIPLFYSVELFHHVASKESIKQPKILDDHLYQALRWGRMAITEPAQSEWVCERIPDEKLEDCPSIRRKTT